MYRYLLNRFWNCGGLVRSRKQAITLRACSPQLIFSSVQFNSVQFSSVQFNSDQFSSVQTSSVQFSSALDNTFTLTYHYSFQFSSIQFSSYQFSSVQFNSIQFSSVQFSSVQFSSAVLCRREQALTLGIILKRIIGWRSRDGSNKSI